MTPGPVSDTYGGPVEWCDGSEPDPVSGQCCSCGYAGKMETLCGEREDESHCEHWWDGADDDDDPHDAEEYKPSHP